MAGYGKSSFAAHIHIIRSNSASYFPTGRIVKYICSSDSLEEVIGLDVGYQGGVLQARGHEDEVTSRMDNYIAEYVKQREERAALKQAYDTSMHGRTLLGVSLHSVLDNSLRRQVLDNSSRSETNVKVNSLARATSAIDLMERSSIHSRKSSQMDSEQLSKSESLSEIKESMRSTASDPIRHSNSNEVQDEPWRDN